MTTKRQINSEYYVLVDDNLKDADHQYKFGMNEGKFLIKPGLIPDVTCNGTYFKEATTICKVHLPLDDKDFEYKEEWYGNFTVNKLKIVEGEQYKITDDATYGDIGVDVDRHGPFILNHALKYCNVSELEFIVSRLGSRSLSHAFIYAGSRIDPNAIHWLREHHPHLLGMCKKLTFDTSERLVECLNTGLDIDLLECVRHLNFTCLDILNEKRPDMLKQHAKDIVNSAVCSSNMVCLEWFALHPEYPTPPSSESIKYVLKKSIWSVIKFFLDNPHFCMLDTDTLLEKSYKHFLNGNFDMFLTLYRHSSTKDDTIRYFEDKIAENQVLKTYFKHSAICKELHQTQCCEDDCKVCKDCEDDEDDGNNENDEN